LCPEIAPAGHWDTHLPHARRFIVALTLAHALLCSRGTMAADATYEQSIEDFLHENLDRGDFGMVVALVAAMIGESERIASQTVAMRGGLA
jgi:hypothetical protein